MAMLRKPVTILLLPFFFMASVAITGCASGGFHWTRKWAGFVNSQHIIIRILLYIFLGIVFTVTLLLDLVIFNTMDFWEGKVSDGSHTFKDGTTLYAVQHWHSGAEGRLRNTRIEVTDASSGRVSRTILITEVSENRIQLFENGKLLAEADDILTLPMVTKFDAQGNRIDTFLALGQPVLMAKN